MNLMPNNNSTFEAGIVIVALNKDFVCSNSPDCYNDILQGIDFEAVNIIFQSTDSSMGDIISVQLKHNDNLSVIQAINKLLANPYVIYAEPSFLFDMQLIPNDPYFRYLWGARQIQSTQAWNYTTGSADVVVGVIDSGIDFNHPDIKSNLWISQNRQYIDGWNFLDNNNNSMDTTGHGTHVAGTIGAVGNNFLGITGMCWRVQVASLKIGHIHFSLEAAIAAINFANQHNIPILNNSWGGRFNSPILKLVIEQYDGLFIAAAGNHGTNNDILPLYPASYDCDNIISVAATNQNNTLAPFSNYGVNSVDIAAPGTNILGLTVNGGYIYNSGTSMSAPYVAGAAALLKAYIPDLTTSDIKSIILSSAEKHPNLSDKVLTSGILNMNAMFELANRYATNSFVSYEIANSYAPNSLARMILSLLALLNMSEGRFS